jgi:hypothetical protein
MRYSLYTQALLLAFLWSNLCFAGPVEEFHFINSGSKAEVRRELVTIWATKVGKAMEPGSVLHVIEVPSFRTLGSFIVPHGSQSARIQHRSLRAAWAGVSTFIQEKVEDTTHVDLPRIPGAMQRLRLTKLPPRVIIVGSTVYDDPRYPTWKFNPRVPSHQCLRVDGCPFTSGVASFPEGTKLTWWNTVEDMAIDLRVRNKIEEFYRLFCSEHGAELIKVTDSGTSAIDFENGGFIDEVTFDEAGGIYMVDYSGHLVMDRPIKADTFREGRVSPPVPGNKIDTSRPRAKKSPRANSGVRSDNTSKQQPEVRSQENSPQANVLDPLTAIDCRNGTVAFVFDASRSLVMTQDKVDVAWKQASHKAMGSRLIRELPFKNFAVMGFWSFDYEDGRCEPQFSYFRRWLFVPRAVEATVELRQEAVDFVMGMESQGGTPTLQALENASVVSGLKTIILFTDGTPHNSAPEDVIAYVRQLALKGITVHTMGVGTLPGNTEGYYDEAGARFMLDVANAGGGHYFAIERIDAAK